MKDTDIIAAIAPDAVSLMDKAIAEIKRLRELEEENAKLKRMYADVSLEVRALKDLFEKKGWEVPSVVRR